MRFIFAITCPLTYHLSQTLHLYAIRAFKISSYYCIKVVEERKGLSCIYEKYVFSPVLFLCMIFVEITFCPSINLEQSVMVLVLFLTYWLSTLRNALADFSRTTEFTGFKLIQGRILYSGFSYISYHISLFSLGFLE